MKTPTDKPSAEHDEQAARTSSRSGQRAARLGGRRWAFWILPLAGAVSLLWFLIRVLPKPSRAAYPCQRAAFPLASAFVVWLTGLVVFGLAWCRARRLADQGRYLAAGGFAAVAAALAVVYGENTTPSARAEFVPADPANSPIGVGKGIYPGRVAWAYDPNATKWDGVTGHWWDDQNLDPQAVARMLSHTLWTLTGQKDDATAWDALFRHFNRTHGGGDVGYQPGERIAIKVNLNPEGYGPAYDTGGGNGRMPSPQLIHALLAQLFDKVHVSGANVTIYDASRAIADPLYNRIHGDADPNFQNVKFVANTTRNGRVGAVYDAAYPVHFANPSVGPANNATVYLPTCVTEAKYLINLAPLSGHSMFGFTASGKNWFGSICWRTNANYFPWNGGWTPSPLHNFGLRNNAMGTYNPIVDLIGHSQLGGKTLLYLVDGLYGSDNAITRVLRFSSFGDNWTASVFASQDSVAIDSVMLDFLRNEPLLNTNCSGQGVDNYLHEAAQAGSPPSGSFYDPGSTGSRLASLGVHEHWNNAMDKQYSRNLGRSEGIELVAWSEPAPPVSGACRLINMSILTAIESPGEICTLGYVVRGPGSYLPLMIRAAGPSLRTLGVSGTLDDPRMELYTGSAKMGENDNWGGGAALVQSMQAVGAFAYTGPDSRDAAAALMATGGENTVRVSAAGNGTGAVLAELYDATPAAGSLGGATPRLVNLSVLKRLGNGVTVGFVIGGNGAKRILIRAIGPGLVTVFGLSGTVDDPLFTLYRDRTAVGGNDNWGGTANLKSAFTQTGAFMLPDQSRDAAAVFTLQPGTYTIVVTGRQNNSSTALVEVYEIDDNT